MSAIEDKSRRHFLLTGALALPTFSDAFAIPALPLPLQQVRTDTLEITYRAGGPENGHPVVLVHDLGYDIHSFTATANLLAKAGLRVIVPYMRGHGATRYLDPATPRSGQQAALGHDLLDLINALHIPEAVFAGVGWGASAATVMAALRPSRAVGLVLAGDEGIDDAAARPLDPRAEAALWYQFYFQTERGRLALHNQREAVMREVWRSADRRGVIDEAAFALAAHSFTNPDFVETMVHAFRYRLCNAPGDPNYAQALHTLATRGRLTVPVAVLQGAASARPPARQEARTTAAQTIRRIQGAAHDVPRAAPHEFAAAVIAVARAALWRT